MNWIDYVSVLFASWTLVCLQLLAISVHPVADGIVNGCIITMAAFFVVKTMNWLSE